MKITKAEIKGECQVQTWKRRKGKYVLKKRRYNPQTM